MICNSRDCICYRHSKKGVNASLLQAVLPVKLKSLMQASNPSRLSTRKPVPCTQPQCHLQQSGNTGCNKSPAGYTARLVQQVPVVADKLAKRKGPQRKDTQACQKHAPTKRGTLLQQQHHTALTCLLCLLTGLSTLQYHSPSICRWRLFIVSVHYRHIMYFFACLHFVAYIPVTAGDAAIRLSGGSLTSTLHYDNQASMFHHCCAANTTLKLEV